MNWVLEIFVVPLSLEFGALEPAFSFRSILVFPVTPRSVCVYVWLVTLSTLLFSYWIFVTFLLCHVHL